MLATDRTLIVVTHDPTGLERFDRVVELRDGSGYERQAMRRLLIGLVLLTVVVIAVVFVTSRGDDEPKGETERGAPGFPLRGSLADDTDAIDTAVAEWREETAEDAKEAEEDDDDGDDAETRDRHARRPDSGDDVTVLWIGRVDEREEVAVLESQGGLLALLTRRESGSSWFVRSERVHTGNDFRGNVPIGVGDAILTPARNEWRYVDAGYSSSYQDVGDGLLWADGSVGADGFVLPQRPGERRGADLRLGHRRAPRPPGVLRGLHQGPRERLRACGLPRHRAGLGAAPGGARLRGR